MSGAGLTNWYGLLHCCRLLSRVHSFTLFIQLLILFMQNSAKRGKLAKEHNWGMITQETHVFSCFFWNTDKAISRRFTVNLLCYTRRAVRSQNLALHTILILLTFLTLSVYSQLSGARFYGCAHSSNSFRSVSKSWSDFDSKLRTNCVFVW